MDIAIVISLIFSFLCIILGFILEGGTIVALLQLTAAIIVIGGTVGAVCISTPVSTLKKFPKIFGVAFRKKDNQILDDIIFFRDIAIKTRREGLLSLESELNNNNMDDFIQKGLQMIIDGISPEMIKNH